MKLLSVGLKDGYIVIETDQGKRYKKIFDGDDPKPLLDFANRLRGKNIITTTRGSWAAERWFDDIREVTEPEASSLSTAKVEYRKTGPELISARTKGQRSLEVMTIKAESGDPDAQFALAEHFDRGQDTARDLKQAMYWYERAAAQGNKSAAQLLGKDQGEEDRGRQLPAGEVTKIYGPPGTGKTTTLIGLVSKAIGDGIKSDQIGYFSYTNKATEEAKERIRKKFPQLDVAKDFPYFQTLHSLANRSFRTKAKLLTEQQARQFFKEEIVVEYPLRRPGDETSRVLRVSHAVLDAAHTARAIKQPLDAYLRNMPPSQRWPLNKWLRAPKREEPFTEAGIKQILDCHCQFESYKRSLGAIDYADMLQQAIDQRSGLPRLELLIVDEAQDLTPVQWDLVRILIAMARRTYVAGDDDQAICEPLGARALEFVSLPSNQADWVLEESHRVPPAIHASLAPLIGILDNCYPYRKKKAWRPKGVGASGDVWYVDGMNGFLDLLKQKGNDINKSAVLVMSPTKDTLRTFSSMLQREGVSHYLLNELVGVGETNIELLTIWGAKGGEAELAALLQASDMDKKMLRDDPRLEYVAVTRAKEAFCYVGFPEANSQVRAHVSSVDHIGKGKGIESQAGVSPDAIKELSARFRRTPRSKGRD